MKIELYPKMLVKRYFAEVLGIDMQTFEYHLKKGDYPAPSHRIGNQPDPNLYYSEDDVQTILKFWEGRRYYQREPSKVTA